MTPPYEGFNRTEFPIQFGRRLKALRNLRGMSQVVLAHRAGYAPQTISNLERGLWPPTIPAMLVLAEVLDVHPKTLLFGDEEP